MAQQIYSTRFERLVSMDDSSYRPAHHQEWYNGTERKTNFVPVELTKMFCDCIGSAMAAGARVDYSHKHGSPALPFRSELIAVANQWLSQQAVVDGTAESLVDRFISQY